MTLSLTADVDPTGIAFADFYRQEWTGAVRLAGLLTQNASQTEDLAQEALPACIPSG